jgi:hypothetical protein
MKLDFASIIEKSNGGFAGILMGIYTTNENEISPLLV